VMLIVLILVSRMVVPKFIEIYKGIGVELPYVTSVMLMILEKCTTIIPFVLLFIVLMIGVIRYLIKKEHYKRKWDRFLLNMPQIGEILLASYWSQILRALEVLVSAGVDMYKSLQHAKAVATRIPLKETLEHASKAVLSGRMIHTSLQRNLEYVPAIAVGMIAAGENTGSLEHMLATTAEYLEDELNHRIELFMKVLEPALIVAVGIIVGFVVLALYLPIFTLASKM
jgi:type II secretory pathway component PulF